MPQLRVFSPAEVTPQVTAVLRDEPTLSALAVIGGASLRPAGDLSVARETANGVIDRLRARGVHQAGSIQVDPVRTWVSRPGYDAEPTIAPFVTRHRDRAAARFTTGR